MPTPNRSLKGQAVPIGAVVFSTSSTCPVPANYIGLWFDGTTLFRRDANGTDTSLSGTADQVVSTAGATAVDLTKRTTSYDGATAGDNITSTLADGSYLGQRHTLRMQSVTSGKTAVITPAHFSDGVATITLAAKFDAVELEWQTRGWIVVGKAGTPTIA